MRTEKLKEGREIPEALNADDDSLRTKRRNSEEKDMDSISGPDTKINELESTDGGSLAYTVRRIFQIMNILIADARRSVEALKTGRADVTDVEWKIKRLEEL